MTFDEIAPINNMPYLMFVKYVFSLRFEQLPDYEGLNQLLLDSLLEYSETTFTSV